MSTEPDFVSVFCGDLAQKVNREIDRRFMDCVRAFEGREPKIDELAEHGLKVVPEEDKASVWFTWKGMVFVSLRSGIDHKTGRFVVTVGSQPLDKVKECANGCAR